MQNFLYQTTNSEDAFQAYQLYSSIRNHFTTKYDYFKYNGRTKTAKANFLKRPDVYWFHKLAKHPNKIEFLVANFVYGEKEWIGNLLQNNQAEDYYTEYIKVRDSLFYFFKQDLAAMQPDFDSNLAVVDGQHPIFLKLLLRKEIRIETFTILEDLCSFSRKWNRRIVETTIWPTIHFKVQKFKPFLSYDKDKFKKEVVDFFQPK